MSWKRFNQTLNNYILQENKIRKNINPKDFLWNAKQECPCQSLESFSIAWKIKSTLTCVCQTNSPNLQCWKWPRWSRNPCMTDWVHKNGAPVKKVKRCQLPTSAECMCCHEIPAVRAFHLKFKARLLWNTAVQEFFAVEFNCVENHFLEGFFSEIS